MLEDLLNDKELQELLSSLKEGETTEDGRDQPLGRWGRMAMDYLHENHPTRFMILRMEGKLTDLMYKVDEEASAKIWEIYDKLLEKDPVPETDDILERTRHMNKHKNVAEEIVIQQIVLKKR